MLEHHLPGKRKRIALIVTVCVAIALVATMVVVYHSPQYRGQGEESFSFKDFLNDLIEDSSPSDGSLFAPK